MARFYVVHFDVDSKTSVIDEKKVIARNDDRCEIRWSKTTTYEGTIVGEAGEKSSKLFE